MQEVVQPVTDLIKTLSGPVLGVVVALGSVYCIILGVKFAKAEEPQDREKAKAHLKNAIIGFVLIFVMLVALMRLTPFLVNWVTKNQIAQTNYNL
ncbi:MAG: pilin [Lachnospiraceae bacterium]|nr:pilin [Lachnospiraceae bacterium]